MIEPVLFMTCGAALYGGMHHLYQGAKNPGGYPHVLHAVLFLLLAGFALSDTSRSLVHSAEELSLYSKLSVSLGLLLFATLPWFIILILKQRASVLPALVSFAWGALLLINIASPYSLLFRQVTETRAVLASGQPSIAFTTAANPIWHLVEIAMLGTLVYAMYLCARQFRTHGKSVPAIPLAGLLLLFGTTAYDSLVYAGLVHTAYLAPLGFLLFLASAGLCWRPATEPGTRQTSSDTNHYQLTMNFNDSPAERREVPVDIPAEAEVSATQLTRQPIVQPAIDEPPATPPLHINNPMVDRVSDGLVDIAVDASLMLKRLDEGEIDTMELKELGRKLRKQAIETRRVTHRMLRTERFGQKD
ncbi:hypothetical protein DFR30_1394 [Thiogranum longum]|uniref:Uncharacterized protein n=1 Tax=Thiogranum longum TaxID=1537524 RepID=A0A4R1HBZ8_9GAMM|nr:hypothetical protein [Thiogranum longum]TCK18131.1 hypothetical protein DFR30_1394 [Thiogranum longum]